jgi:ribokinase
MLYDKLRENGVNLTLMQHSGGVSGHAIIQVDDNGQNCILLYGGTNQALTEAYIDQALEAFGNEGLVLVQNETNLVGTIIEKAHQKGLQVAINASPMDEKILSYPLEMVDWLVVNEIEGAAIAGCEFEVDILPKLKQRYPKMNVLLTLGKRGAICARGDEQTKIGIYSVKVVDTTAAGDTFLGYFLTEALDHKSLIDALSLATAASSLCVQAMGASDSVPQRVQVERAIAESSLGKLGEWGGWR